MSEEMKPSAESNLPAVEPLWVCASPLFIHHNKTCWAKIHKAKNCSQVWPEPWEEPVASPRAVCAQHTGSGGLG